MTSNGDSQSTDPTVQLDAEDILHRLAKNPNVVIRDRDTVLRKFNKLIAGGFDKLMVISDFDFTITKFEDEKGERCSSTHGVFDELARKLTSDLYDQFEKLKTKFMAIEFDPHMSVEEKIPYMEQWWTESHGYIVEHKFERERIRTAVQNSRVFFRDGAQRFLGEVCEKGVPLVLFSAGIGNLIEMFLLHKLGKIPSNLHIVSNMMNFDDNGICVSFSEPLIHTFNKNASVVGQRDFFHSVRARSNVLLLGDSLGDLHMDVGVEEESTKLSVGFLNFNVEALREQYERSFDIVVIRDSTMEVPEQIFSHIHDSITANVAALAANAIANCGS